MAKRRAHFHAAQLALSFDAVEPSVAEGALAHLNVTTSSAVAMILRDDPRSRFDVAAAVSKLLDEDCSKWMLNAYSAPARNQHSVPFYRLLALVVATQRYDVLFGLLKEIGATGLKGEEVYVAELGHVQAQIAALRDRERTLSKLVKPIRRGGGQ